jgi:NAD(P)-dependent dehydrogenase (short-subunit alcohol dehydrogenase family)
MDAGENIIKTALDAYGKVDGLVNVAGILRDRMVFNMTEEEWDAVLTTHLKGTFTTTKFASILFRQQRYGRVVNFSSISGLWGNAGQANYGAAKEGIAGLTRCVARDMGRYGVTCNAIAPLASTRMTQTIPTGQAAAPGRRAANLEFFEDMEVPDNGPQHIAPAVCYLLGDESWNINGQIFHVTGGQIGVLPYLYPPAKFINKDIARYGRWTQAELKELVHPMLISGVRNMAPPPPDLDLPGRPAEAAATA